MHTRSPSLFALLGLTLAIGCGTAAPTSEDGTIDPGQTGDGGSDDGSTGDGGSAARSRVQGQIVQEIHISSSSGEGYSRGSFSSATELQVLVHGEDGDWETWEGSGDGTEEGSGEVEEDGSFDIEVPAGEDGVILQAVDANGSVVGMAILESTGEEGSESTVRNLDVESWVESMVYLEATGDSGEDGSEEDFVNVISLMTWIDASVSEQVFADFEDDGDGSEALSELTASIETALQTELDAWSERGFDYSSEALFDLMLDASQSYSESTSEGESSAQATLDLLADLETAFRAEGSDEEDWQSVYSMTSLAWRLSISAMFEDDGASGEAMTDAAWSSAGRIEGHFAISYVEHIVASYGAAGDGELAGEITSALQASLSGSSSSEDSSAAFDAWSSALVEGEGSLLEDGLDDGGGLDAFFSSLLEGSIESSYDESEDFDASISSAVSSMVEGSGSWDSEDSEGMSSLVVESFTSLQSDLRATSEEAGDEMSSSQASFMSELVLAAMTTFRGEG